MTAKAETKVAKANAVSPKGKTIVFNDGYHYEAEQSLMGQLMGGYPDMAYEIATGHGIGMADWGEGDHVILWGAITTLHEHGTPTLALTVRDLLRTTLAPPQRDEPRKTLLESMSNPDLIDIYSETPMGNVGDIQFSAMLIKEGTAKREVAQRAATLTRNLYSANGNSPEIAIAETERMSQAAEALAADKLGPNDPELIRLPADDHGNAQAIHLVFPEYLHTNELGWLRYDGAKWENRLAEKQLSQAAVRIIRRRNQLAKRAYDKELIGATRATKATVNNAMAMLRDSIAFASLDEFDSEPGLLNCRNGVVNLQTGDLIPHDPSQKFTYMVPVDYDPEADYSSWEGWLWETLTPAAKGDPEGHYLKLVEWLKLAIGYSLTGETYEQCLFYVFGPSRAGKGTFMQIISALLGSRLVSGVDASTLTAKRSGDSQNFDLAPLKQNRMITVSETERRGRLNDRMVKAMTGDDPIRCAHKFGTPFSYVPQFKIWVTSNFEVSADPIDTALWGRLRIIEFPNSHLGKEDKTLKRRLLAGLPAVLNWAVQGAVKWYDLIENGQGLEVPEAMQAEVQKHRDFNDSVAQFIEACCVTGDEYRVPVTLMRSDYVIWCNENGYEPFKARAFNQNMESKGFERANLKHAGEDRKCWRSIGLSAK